MLSVFEVTQVGVETEKVLSTFHMFDEGDLLAVGVDRALLDAAGIELIETTGYTLDTEVNSWHREIEVPSLIAAEKLARIFAEGQPIMCEKGPAFKRIAAQSREHRILLAQAWKGGPMTKQRTGRLIDADAAMVIAPPRSA